MDPKEWFNQNLPLANSQGMKDMAALRVGPTATSVDLRALFGKVDNGHLWTVKARAESPSGFTALFALSPNPMTINPSAGGTSSGVGWPLLDGQEIRGTLMGGREAATGMATLTTYTVLNVRAGNGGGTGWLHLYRSSVSPPQGVEQFPIPSGVLAI